jgi:hypothetical protein
MTYQLSKGIRTIQVSGQDDVVADNAAGAITFVNGSNVTITTSGSGDTVTFAASSGGGGGSVDLLGSSTSAVTPGASAAIDATHTTNHTIATDNVIIPVNTSSSAVTITLYAVSGNGGRVICVKDVGGAAYTNNITIDANSSETIDGATTQTIASNYGSLSMFCDGSAWFII